MDERGCGCWTPRNRELASPRFSVFRSGQRRRRVYLLFSRGAGNWNSARALFPVAESVRGDPPPSRKAREDIAAGALRSTDGGSDVDHARANQLVPDVAWALQARDWRGADSNTKAGHLIPDVAPTLRAGGNRTGGDRPPGTDVDTCESLIPTLADPLVVKEGATYTHEGKNFRTRNIVGVDGGGQVAVAFKPSHYTRGKDGQPSETVPPLSADADKGDQDPVIMVEMRVRRLTPRECERLQGFPDNFTLVPYEGKPAARCADGPRYKVLGNTMTTTVMKWIGRRIEEVEHA